MCILLILIPQFASCYLSVYVLKDAPLALGSHWCVFPGEADSWAQPIAEPLQFSVWLRSCGGSSAAVFSLVEAPLPALVPLLLSLFRFCINCHRGESLCLDNSQDCSANSLNSLSFRK